MAPVASRAGAEKNRHVHHGNWISRPRDEIAAGDERGDGRDYGALRQVTSVFTELAMKQTSWAS
jgi:hypothetical protein